MLNLSLLKNLLIIAIALSTITVSFIQKTKKYLPNKKIITLYSLLINFLFSYFFCQVFTSDISKIESIWIGLFSFLGADTLYVALEGKLAPYSEIINNKNDNKEIVGEITYE